MMFSLLPVSAAAADITDAHTPKDVIYIDQYYNSGKALVKWTGKHITLNGPDLLKNNAAEAAVIEKTVLTDDMEEYRFLTVNGVTYDFSFACLFPRKSDKGEITDLWYKDKANLLGQHWFYSHTNKNIITGFGATGGTKGNVNFCYNKEHNEKSKYHKFNQLVKTVKPTCTAQGYTEYKCEYCDETEQRETAALGHAWSAWTHDDATSGADSMHTHTCMRKGCNETERSQCKFTISGTAHICKDCKYTYVDYTLTYDANGGKWSAAPSGYTMNEGNTTATIKGLAASTKVGAAPAPAQDN